MECHGELDVAYNGKEKATKLIKAIAYSEDWASICRKNVAGAWKTLGLGISSTAPGRLTWGLPEHD